MTTDTTTNYNWIAGLAGLIDEIPPETIISRTVHKDDHLGVTLFGFAAGQELTEHTASRPAVLHFLNGTGTLTLGEDVHQVQPGAWVHMPANLPHSIVAHTPLTMLLLLLKTAA